MKIHLIDGRTIEGVRKITDVGHGNIALEAKRNEVTIEKSTFLCNIRTIEIGRTSFANTSAKESRKAS